MYRLDRTGLQVKRKKVSFVGSMVKFLIKNYQKLSLKLKKCLKNLIF